MKKNYIHSINIYTTLHSITKQKTRKKIHKKLIILNETENNATPRK